MRKSTLSQLTKYDISQKIFDALTDYESRLIIFSLIRKAKHAEEISHETDIPLSTVYDKLNNLKELTLIQQEKIELSEFGRRLKYFRSRISEAQIFMDKMQPKIVLVPNKRK